MGVRNAVKILRIVPEMRAFAQDDLNDTNPPLSSNHLKAAANQKFDLKLNGLTNTIGQAEAELAIFTWNHRARPI